MDTEEPVVIVGDDSDNITLDGTNEADKINSGDGDDTVLAGGGDDKINAGDGDDTIVGGAGDDSINGGDGFDIAVYEGDVQVYINEDGLITLSDGKGNTLVFDTGTAEGTDTLRNIEAIQFNNYTFYLDGRNNQALAIDDSASTDEDTALSAIDVLSNDIDLDGDSLSVTGLDTTLSAGMFTLNIDGTIGYDPNGGFEYLATGETATDTVDYTITDGNGSTTTARLTITITGVNDAAVVASTSITVTEDDPGTSLNLLGNSSDVDTSDVLTVESVLKTAGDDSGLTVNANGTIGIDPSAYDSLASGENSVITYSYDVVEKDDGGTELSRTSTTASITITGVNDAPVAVDDEGSALETEGSKTFTFSELLADDYDIDQLDTLSITSFNSASLPVGVSLDVDWGAETVTVMFGESYLGLNEGESEVVTFGYAVQDNHGQVSATEATVSLTIAGVTQVNLANGGFVVVWTSFEQDGSSTGIYGQRYDSTGNASAGEFQVNTNTNSHQNTPSVTALNDGGFLVTWTSSDQDGSGYGIYAQRYGLDGSTSGSEFQVNTTTSSHQLQPSVTALTDGGFVVTWSSYLQDGSVYGVYGQRYDATGSTTGGEFQVNTTTASQQYEPNVIALADGGFVVTWSSLYQDDGSTFGIYGQRYASDGSTSGGEFQINTTTYGSQVAPSVTALADGGFVVTWASYLQDGSSFGIYSQRFGADGTASGNEFQVNTSTLNNQIEPSVTALVDGGFVVTWSSTHEDSSINIYGQRFGADGNVIGNEFQVNTNSDSNQLQSSVTDLADGGFVVTWSSYLQDSSGYGIYGQRYDADGSASGGEFQVNTYTNSSQYESDVAGLITNYDTAITGDTITLGFDDLESASSNLDHVNPYGTSGYQGFDFGVFYFLETDEHNVGGSENLANQTGSDNVLWITKPNLEAKFLGGYEISSEDGSEFDFLSALMAKDSSGSDSVTFTAYKDGVAQGSETFTATQTPSELMFDQAIFSDIDEIQVSSGYGYIAFDDLTFASVDWVV